MAITMNLTLAKILVSIGGALVISALVLYLLIFQYPYYFLYFQDSKADKAIIEKRVAELGWRIERKVPFVFIGALASGSLYPGNDCEKKCIDLLSEDRVGEIVANDPENFRNSLFNNKLYIYTNNINKIEGHPHDEDFEIKSINNFFDKYKCDQYSEYFYPLYFKSEKFKFKKLYDICSSDDKYIVTTIYVDNWYFYMTNNHLGVAVKNIFWFDFDK
jgi:hypothetical protein